MKKILKLEKPWIRYSQDYAFPSAVLSADVSFQNWIYSNAIQLYYIKNRNKFNISYFYLGFDPNPIAYIPLFRYQGIDLKWIKKSLISPIEFVKSILAEEYYITCLLNDFYIPSRGSYCKNKFEHGTMIYGIDEVERAIYIAGYNVNRKFSEDKISFDIFEKAFMDIQREDDFASCFKRNDRSYKFDISLVKELLYDYIYAIDTSKRTKITQLPSDEYFWGLEACEHILDGAEYSFDTRYFYMMYEYIKLMLERYKYIVTNIKSLKDDITYELNDLVIKFNVMLNVILRSNMQNKFNENKEKVRLMLERNLMEEKRVLKRFYIAIS